MTEQRAPSRTPHSSPPQGGPATPRRRPSEERAEIAASSRTATQLAAIAIVLAALALGLAIWRTLMPAGSSCQRDAWSAAPAADQLPSSWTVRGATFDVSRRTTSYVGPDPGDGSGSVPTILATVTCYSEGASDAVARSAEVARSMGDVVNDRPDLGDQGFEATDDSGALYIQFRHGDLVVDLAGGSGTTIVELDTIASGYDRSLGGDGGTIPSADPNATDATGGESPAASDDTGAAASPAAPELEKLLPAKVGSVDLLVESQLGSTVLQDDQGSRAILAALRAAGKTADDLRFADAYDPNDTSDLTILAVTVNGMDVAKVRQLIMDTWLAASGAGVTKTDVTLGGKAYTKVDLGDQGRVDYVRTADNVVFVITTADEALAGQAAALLP